MNNVVDASVAQPKLLTQLVGAFATFALLLAAIGIYGVMAYSVARRTQELGIRVALGAQPADILKIVLGQGMRLVLIGLGLGVAVSLGLTRLLSSLLFGSAPPIRGPSRAWRWCWLRWPCSLPIFPRAGPCASIPLLRCVTNRRQDSGGLQRFC